MKEALAGVSDFVEDGGYIHIGLYHKFGREPFLGLFERWRKKIADGVALSPEEADEAYEVFKDLNKNITDEVFLRSWFRDQVLHPHETQHTFGEVAAIFEELGFRPLSTSINRYGPIDDAKALSEEEKRYCAVSVERNIKAKTYFPGFFTVLARKG